MTISTIYGSRIKLLLPAMVILVLAGCGDSDSEDGGDTADTSTTNVSIDKALDEKLALADAADGEADKTIHKCYSCALGMDGEAELSVEVNGYTAHLCSEYCQEHFAKDAEKIVSETAIPAAKTDDKSNDGESDSDSTSE